MLRLRAALLVVVVLLLVWLVRAHVANGLDVAATEYALGTQATEAGLPALGSLLLGRASAIYEGRLKAGTPPETARARFIACEFALGRLFAERGQAAKAKQHYLRVKSRCPEVAVQAKAWSAYVDAHAGEAGGPRTLLGLVVDAPQEPLPAYLAGRLFLEEGRTDEAQRYLAKSLALPEGKTYPTTLALGQALSSAGKREPATEQAEQALELAVSAGEKRAAAALLRTLGAEGPDPTLAWLSTFAAQHAFGLISLGLAVAVLLWPTWLGLLARLVPSAVAPLYLLFRSSEPSAIRTYEAALRRRPNNARLLRALAGAYRRVGVGATRSAELWERLYALDPEDEEARNQTVHLALESGRESEASLSACAEWFEANPDHPDAGAVAAHLARAYRARPTMPPAGALPAVELAAAAAPADRDLRLFLGTLYSHCGRHAQAASVLAGLLAERPFDEATRLQYAHALIGSGEAYQAFRHLRSLGPSTETTTDLYLAGVAAHNAGRFQESLRILQEVVRRDPTLFDVEERVADASARVTRDRVGRYELNETVAVHEAYVLHRAAHPEHGIVLLMVFRRDFSDALEFPEAFAESLGSGLWSLPGCARVLDAGAEQEEFYVAYEMPAGASLAQVLETRGPMEPEEAAQAMGRTLDTLAELHGAGHLHGDLRLSVVWLADDARVTLVAAGATLAAEASPGAVALGARSPFHVAPEVVQHRQFSVASDLYAAGCMLFELLVGSPPLQGPTHLATIMAHVTIEPEPPSMRAPNIPPELDDLVLQALAKDPGERPRSAQEYADALRAVVKGRGDVATSVAGAVAAEVEVPPIDHPVPTATVAGPIDPARWWTAYQDLAPLANGRFSRVYRGAHRQTGEWHAIKHLQIPHGGSGGEGLAGARAARAILRLFSNEMHVLQSLCEAGPVPEGLTLMLQAYRADENSPAYAMPLMHETLAQHIEREGALPEAEAIRAFVPLALAVAGLHERGLVHRGISPRSVMLDRHMRLQLGGFDSICRLTEREALLQAEHEVQQASRSPLYILGDIRYLSPERCRGEDFSERTDLYSLGAVLFYMLAGVAPFERADEMQIMLDHVSSPPPRLDERQVHVSLSTQETIDRALAKSPAARFASARAMIEALTGEPLGSDQPA